VRTTLIPGALKTLAFNKSMSHKEGIKLFEISDIVLPADNEVGALNARRLVALYASYSAGFEVIHGLADRIMTCVQIKPEKAYAMNSLTGDQYGDLNRVGRAGVTYSVRPSSDPTCFPGMGAEVVLHWEEAGKEDQVVGTFGVVHPEVLQNFEVTYPCSILEMDVEALM
jgi:phenylalanyl-tRNA synthetase beta chain